ncbi:MAG: lipoate--protein ligase family protein [Armatimonadetes bacterium]|nr:lipoate--protein ligase family protein [Armatimonadota bacterium]MDW8029867.1 biotin/lipoate A/B protein ligase family protein [Armatimonadota bacterium]
MVWRLVYSPALNGSWNMAIDEAILLAQSAGIAPPTLRLYKWQPAAVSLGLLQAYETINEEGCKQLGFEIVRRPSGGGAVLHQQEITYSVVFDSRICPYGSSVMATYHWIAKGLIAGLKELGVEASVPTLHLCDSNSPSNFCFVRLTGADLSVKGKKLGGSAQARRRNFLLQHGSIPLSLGMNELRLIFGDIDFEQFTCIDWVLGRKVSFDEFADALVCGFEKAFNINFSVRGLTDEELELAILLVELKYGTEMWTKERKAEPELAQQIKIFFEKAKGS